MKRRISLLLAVSLLVVTTCACGGEKNGSSQSATAASSVPVQTEPEELDLTLAFTGDINLDDDWYVMQYLKQSTSGALSDCIDPILLNKMNQADLCCINNEFAISDRGEKLPGKAYTFRAKPENVSYLKEMGADLVTLSNNHIYDYGEDAFYDTLDNLSQAGIDFVGAGRNKAEATKPLIYDLNGLKVAYVNATRAELTLYTPDAGENTPGVLSCYDPALFQEVIAQAKEQADLVVCCVHWGIEYSYELEQVQKDTARDYIDAGADVIVGTHSHCLQGIEYYNGVPIFYNLGNFWFNEKDLLTCLLELHVTGTKEDWKLDATIVPAHQAGCKTQYLSDGSSVYQLMESISVNAGIQPDGTVYEKQN